MTFMFKGHEWEAGDLVRLIEIARATEAHFHVITNALHNQADRFDEAAKEARTHYDAGQADPEVKARQDRSGITNHGYKRLAIIFEEEAAKARTAANDLQARINGDEDDD